MIDLGIVGGGPAGSMAAWEAARRGLSVMLWEKDRFPRDKVCGEFLSAECLPLLHEAIPRALGRSAVIRGVELIPRRGRTCTFDLPQPARGLSRWVMDHALLEGARAEGASVREGEEVRSVRKLKATAAFKDVSGEALMGSALADGGWEILTKSGDTARISSLLVAGGRWWNIEGLPSLQDKGRKAWLGVKAHMSGLTPRPVVELYFFPGGYCGLAPIEDGLTNVCCLVDSSVARCQGGHGLGDLAAWLKRLAGHPPLEERLRGAVQASRTLATAPVHLGKRDAVENDIALAGDAAGFLDPFAGSGISLALHSGRLAAEVCAHGSAGKVANGGRACFEEYQRRLSWSSRRSYGVASWLRELVRAPECVQSLLALIARPMVGMRLFDETRWRESG